MLRDNIKLYQNYSSFSYNCPLCSKPDHFFQNCPKLHHIPDNNFLISHFNHCTSQTRAKIIRKRKKMNFRSNYSNILLASIRINAKICDDMKNNSLDLSEDEKEENFPIRKISDQENTYNNEEVKLSFQSLDSQNLITVNILFIF